jgi:hypothetical protein
VSSADSSTIFGNLDDETVDLTDPVERRAIDKERPGAEGRDGPRQEDREQQLRSRPDCASGMDVSDMTGCSTASDRYDEFRRRRRRRLLDEQRREAKRSDKTDEDRHSCSSSSSPGEEAEDDEDEQSVALATTFRNLYLDCAYLFQCIGDSLAPSAQAIPGDESTAEPDKRYSSSSGSRKQRNDDSTLSIDVSGSGESDEEETSIGRYDLPHSYKLRPLA